MPDQRPCPACGFVSPAAFRFCGSCGSPLAAAPAPVKRESAIEGADASAERRQLTVMFCDLAGSTALSEQMDPEELREVVAEFQRVSGAVIERFNGYVAQYLGDGLLVYFGFPEAQEDAPRRAVHAGLGILEALADLRHRLRRERGFPLGARIGIHTGEVVTGDVGSGASQERLALGQTPNVAARLQAAAEVDTVLVSGTTYRLVRDFFVTEPRGTQMLKGLSRAVEAHRIVRESGVRTRFEGAAGSSLTPLLGRDRELALLRDRFDRARAGEAQAVLIEAQPGVGKSRLLKALRDEVTALTPRWWHAGCSPYATDTSLYPLIELIENASGAPHDAPVPRKLEIISEWLALFGFGSPEAVALAASLLSLATPEAVRSGRVTPQGEKTQIFDLLRSVLQRAAGERPLILAFEDLHWMDPSTLEFLHPLVEHPLPARLMVVLTFRPTFAPPWHGNGHLHRITLDHLPAGAAGGLAQRIAGRTLPPEVLDQIVAKTDGVPLFVEELTRMVVESGQLRAVNGHYELAGPLSALEIPATLQDSLMARLDRLQDLKEVAQLASVLGREFSDELFAEAFPGVTDRQARLARLVDAGLLMTRGDSQQGYVFKHALLQDAAYGSLLRSTRRQHHERVAAALERRFAPLLETRPELAAHHFSEAGLADPAIRYWQRAGEIALARSANLEAINHLNRALALLDRLPAGPDRDRRELGLLTTLCPALNTTRGYASPDVERAYARVREICAAIGEVPELFWIVRAQWTFSIVRGDLQKTDDIGQQLLRMATAERSDALVMDAQYAVGTGKFWFGDLENAGRHLELAIATNRLSDPVSLRYVGQHTGVVCLAQMSWLRWLQGAPEEARHYSDQALALAQQISHPLSVTMALFFSIWVHQFLGDVETVEARAREVIARSREQGLFYELLGNLFVGWALAVRKPASADQGIRAIRQCLDMNRASGARLAHTFYLSLLADACIRNGRFDEARQALDEAFATAQTTGEIFWLAELHRLRGELALAADGDGATRDAAAAAFTEAMSIAGAQGARALADRAARSLAAVES